MRCTRGTLPVLAALFLPVAAVGQVPTSAARFQGIPLPNVVNQLVSDAVDTLRARRLANVEIARVWRDDMPPVVLRQFPDPRTTRLVAPGTLITLVVVQPLPRLPDLRTWRTDRAQTYLGAIEIVGRLGDPQAPPDRTMVAGQSRRPGPVMPGDSVLLTLAPLPAPDTVVVQSTDTLLRIDTVRRTDTVPVAATGGGPVGGGGVSYPLAGLLTVGGLGLGLAGARALGPRLPSPSRSSGKGPPEARDRPRRTPPGRLPDFSGEIVDELVWVSKGNPAGGPPGRRVR